MVSALTSQLFSNLYETRNLAVMAWSHKKGEDSQNDLQVLEGCYKGFTVAPRQHCSGLNG